MIEIHTFEFVCLLALASLLGLALGFVLSIVIRDELTNHHNEH